LSLEAIQTRALGTTFRSSLEARWATLFAALQWIWNYETLTLPRVHGKGRIPDFVMSFAHPTLIEVKPATSQAEVIRERRALIAHAADWLCEDSERRLAELDALPEAPDPVTRRAELLEIDEALEHVRAIREDGDNGPWHRGRRALVAGAQLLPPASPWYAQPDALTLDGFHVFANCPGCASSVGLFNHRGCLACGRDDVRPVPVPSADLLMLWREAGNQTRWEPRP
jgi:hypothetical protein